MRCSRNVLEEIFNEEEIMVLHMVTLEMDLADTPEEQAAEHIQSLGTCCEC